MDEKKRIPARAMIECLLCSACGNYATATGGGVCASCALKQQLAAAVERAERAEKFIERLATGYGAIVSSASCSQGEIIGAQNRGDWFQLGSLGFVMRLRRWRELAEQSITDVRTKTEDDAMAAHTFANTINDLRARAEAAEATVAGLIERLRKWNNSVRTAEYSTAQAQRWFFQIADQVMEIVGRTEAATQSQHAARIRERVLREAAERAEKETEDEKGEDSSFFYGIVTADTLREWADEAEKEAQG